MKIEYTPAQRIELKKLAIEKLKLEIELDKFEEEKRKQQIAEDEDKQTRLLNQIYDLNICLAMGRIDETKSHLGGEPVIIPVINNDESFEFKSTIQKLLKQIK